jgi:hypothetical protein
MITEVILATFLYLHPILRVALGIGVVCSVWVAYEMRHSCAERLHLGVLSLTLAVTFVLFPSLMILDIMETREYERCVEVFMEGNTREQSEFICKNA